MTSYADDARYAPEETVVVCDVRDVRVAQNGLKSCALASVYKRRLSTEKQRRGSDK